MAIQRVSPQEAKELQDQGYTYVDVRSVPEFAGGHPVGAKNVPLMHREAGGMTPNPDFLTVFEANFPKDARLIIGCQSGIRSLRAAELLTSAGYQDLIEQRAGFGGARDAAGRVVEPGWAEAGLPVESTGGDYAELAQKAGK